MCFDLCHSLLGYSICTYFCTGDKITKQQEKHISRVTWDNNAITVYRTHLHIDN